MTRSELLNWLLGCAVGLCAIVVGVYEEAKG